jgi:zinc transport system substrate-binding protein
MIKETKKLVIGIFLFLATISYAQVNTVVSILPQQTFVKAIGGDKVNISLMVRPGNSPHTYEPKPSQMKDISKADIYFTIGVEFEKSWIPKFANQNKRMKIVSLSDGIQKLAIEKHSHHDEHGEDEHHEKENESLDPHIWTSTTNVKAIAKNILNALVKLDNENANYYKENYKKFISHIEQTDKNIKEILSDIPKNSKFMVFHPAWGYFAQQYGLTQLAIEAGGKNPKPKHIAYLIEEAKEENVKAIFTAPEFSDNIAKQIANEVGVNVIKVSPLNPKWSQNLENLARAIANK